MPDLAIVVVPHPVGGIDPKEVERKADNIIEDIIKSLTRTN
jgi:hypothetical protein